jgi:hypothetical protein
MKRLQPAKQGVGASEMRVILGEGSIFVNKYSNGFFIEKLRD